MPKAFQYYAMPASIMLLEEAALGRCNKIVCFWSPPASILRAIPKNYYYSAHVQLCNCAMLEEHMSRTEDGNT